MDSVYFGIIPTIVYLPDWFSLYFVCFECNIQYLQNICGTTSSCERQNGDYSTIQRNSNGVTYL